MSEQSQPKTPSPETMRSRVLCHSCRKEAVGAFVQHGSYFMLCTACGDVGPATSWLALGPSLQGRLHANLVNENFDMVDSICGGEAIQCFDKIRQVTGKGYLVELISWK